MTIKDQIKNEKLQYDINREAAKISALSSRKLDKYKYLTGEEILPSNQQQIIQQAKFNYSPLGKAIEKQRKTIEDQGEKQVVALESLKDSDKKLPPIKDFIPMENLNPENIKEIPRNLALGTFGELLIVFSTKVNLLYLLYSTDRRCCLLHLIKQNYLLKTFPRTQILMTLVSLYLFSLLELI